MKNNLGIKHEHYIRNYQLLVVMTEEETMHVKHLLIILIVNIKHKSHCNLYNK